MTNKISCISIDLINADKPPASLAFLAGVCEKVELPYQCISLNSELVQSIDINNYNTLYSKVKLNQFNDTLELIYPVINQILDEIEKFESTLVLVSVFSFLQYTLAEFFLKSLKQRNLGVEIIAGGPGIESEIDNKTIGKIFLDQGLINYYCLGEGDVVLPKFLKGDKIQLGLNCKKSLSETWVPQIDDLDSTYVLPSYKQIKTQNYKNLEQKSSPIYSISTSRGCVRKCSFCDVAKSWPKFRFRSGKLVAEEVLKHHLDVGAVNFTIVDSLINGSLKSFNDFNQSMINLKNQYPSLSEFSYNGMFIVRPKQQHDKKFFQSMKDAGCESLAIGVETGSDRLRFEMDKKFTNADLDHHFEMCQKVGIQNVLLMFVAYPTETKDDFNQTLLMLDRYQKYLIDNTILGINHTGIFTMIKGSPVYDFHDVHGIVVQDSVARPELQWFNKNNPELDVKERTLRDIIFRQKALELRYPIPYSERYLEYLQHINKEFIPISD